MSHEEQSPLRDPLLLDTNEGGTCSSPPKLSMDLGTPHIRTARQLVDIENSRSTLDCILKEADLAQQLQILDFVVSRLGDHMKRMDSASGEHCVLSCLHRVCVEMERVRSLSFDVLALLEVLVGELDCLQPLPSADEVDAFFEDLGRLQGNMIPEIDVDLERFGNIWFMNKNHPELLLDEDVRIVTDWLHEARKCASTNLEEFGERYSRVPVFDWLCNVLIASMRDRNNFALFTYQWASSATHFKPSFRRTRWMMLGEVLLSAADTECICDADVRSSELECAHELQCEVLPSLTLQLKELRTLLQTNVDRSVSMKNHMTATAVTAGITLGHMLVQYIFNAKKCE
mmetsp:Transcript_16601/g.32080  ORF Transcript_16601/g.32080 Transcript_16601/m.32080 type:complete len:344 (+) Transcript_16601:69-1100(+)